MKKLVSRFMAVLMAMTMILSMSMTAFAAEAPKGTLTVNNTVAGKTLAAPWRCGLCGGVCRDACHQPVFEHPAVARCDGAPAARGGFFPAAAEPRPCPAADAPVSGDGRMACAAPVPRRLVPDGFACGLCAAAGPDAAGRQLAAARAAPDA